MSHRHGGPHRNTSVARVTSLDGEVVARRGDHAVAAVAARQHGVVSHAQLLAAGITRRAIERRVQAGRLHRVRKRVYAVGHAAELPLAREAAALLACGPAAVLSHRSAGAIWGFAVRPAGTDVTIVGSDCGAKPGIRVYRARRMAAVDLRRRAGLPLTAPARTLLDLAAALNDDELGRAVNEALVLRLTSERELRDVVERSRGRRGAPRLRRLLAETRGPSMTRSEAERRLLDLVRAAGLPVPETNVRLGRFEVDVLWRAERLVVEVDGYAFHGTRAAFERDRVRDAELQAAGFAVLRVTWRQLHDTPEATVASIARLLARRTLLVESATA